MADQPPFTAEDYDKQAASRTISRAERTDPLHPEDAHWELAVRYWRFNGHEIHVAWYGQRYLDRERVAGKRTMRRLLRHLDARHLQGGVDLLKENR